MRLVKAAASIAALCLGAAAHAVPGPLDIDFRIGDWAPATGNSNFSVGSVTAYAEPQDFKACGLFGCREIDAKLFQDSTDGLGVDFRDPDFTGLNDEIDGIEILKIDFGVSHLLDGFWVSDLGSKEFGSFKIDGSTSNFFGSDADNGFLYVDLGGQSVTSISFLIGDLSGLGGNLTELISDFSVVGFQKVPEPGALLLLAGGLLGFGMRRRVLR